MGGQIADRAKYLNGWPTPIADGVPGLFARHRPPRGENAPMTHLIHPVSETSVRLAVQAWILLLADERYQEASAYLMHEEGLSWPAQMLEEIVADYSARAQAKKPVVTDPLQASGGPTPRHDVRMWSANPEYIGEIWWDLAISGSWSDLTATFLLKAHGNGAVLILEDFRVM